MLTPRQDARFMGLHGRAQSRLRARRRQVLSVLGEAVAFSGLIGAFPPLRAMWVVTGVLMVMLGAYLVMLLRLRLRASRRQPAVILPPADVAVVRRAQHRVTEPASRAAAR